MSALPEPTDAELDLILRVRAFDPAAQRELLARAESEAVAHPEIGGLLRLLVAVAIWETASAELEADDLREIVRESAAHIRLPEAA